MRCAVDSWWIRKSTGRRPGNADCGHAARKMGFRSLRGTKFSHTKPAARRLDSSAEGSNRINRRTGRYAASGIDLRGVRGENSAASAKRQGNKADLESERHE